MPRLLLLQGDITTARVDVLVNAWNRNVIPHWLLLPRGVAGALRRRAGPEPFREVRRAGLLPLGGVAETGAGRLEGVGRIFHAAALHAYWTASEKAITLAATEVFRRAADTGAQSLAIPLLGAGTGGVDPEASFEIIRDAWQQTPKPPQRTEIYVFDFPTYHRLLAIQGWRQGFALLRQGAFWDAHEAWEEIWSLLPESSARHALQALIQIAAAGHKLHQATHRDPANMQRGMTTLLDTATAHLEQARQSTAPLPGFDLAALEQALNSLAQLLKRWKQHRPLDTLLTEARATAAELADQIESSAVLRED